MVVIPVRPALALTLGLLLAPYGALAQPAEPSSQVRLSDAWLSTLQQTDQQVAWHHAFALREETAEGLETQRRRLAAELAPLILSALANGQASLAAGLTQWRETLESTPPLPARTPGRHDLPWLGANQRYDPVLSRIPSWGYCAVPDWIEMWHLGGISRVTWQPGLDLNQALSGLPDLASRDAEQAMVITPAGKQHTRGIAAWNRQATSLTPGSRIMLKLPHHVGETSGIRELINERLPAYLATRLPGDSCIVQEAREEG